MIGAEAGGDENRGRGGAGGDVGGVPRAGRVDRIVARVERDGFGRAREQSARRAGVASSCDDGGRLKVPLPTVAMFELSSALARAEGISTWRMISAMRPHPVGCRTDSKVGYLGLGLGNEAPRRLSS